MVLNLKSLDWEASALTTTLLKTNQFNRVLERLTIIQKSSSEVIY